MKRFILVAALTVFHVGSSTLARQLTPHESEGVAAAVVDVSMAGGSGGSGTSIVTDTGTGLVITAAHVVGRATKGTITWSDGRRTAVTVLATDSRTDLAGLTFALWTDAPQTYVAKANPERGERLWKIGYPVGTSHRTGPDVRVGKCLDARARLYTSTPVHSGDSGGGWFTDAGYLAGAVTGFDSSGQSYGPSAEQIGVFVTETCLPRLRRLMQPPSPAPSPPAPGPPGPPMPPSPKPQPDLAAVLAKLDQLQVQLEELKKRPLPKDGKDGKDGKDAVMDVEALRKEFAEKGFLVEILDEHGAVVQTQDVKLGGKLRLQLLPKSPQK